MNSTKKKVEASVTAAALDPVPASITVSVRRSPFWARWPPIQRRPRIAMARHGREVVMFLFAITHL